MNKQIKDSYPNAPHKLVKMYRKAAMADVHKLLTNAEVPRSQGRQKLGLRKRLCELEKRQRT